MDQQRIAYHYDVQNTSYTYNKFSPPNDGPIPVSTVGSSATVTGTGAFAEVAVGDVLLINNQGTGAVRLVTARASADSITVDAVINIPVAMPFKWLDFSTGTAATDGWYAIGGGPTGRARANTYLIEVVTLGSTSIDYTVETKTQEGGPIQLALASISSATFPANGDTVVIGENAGWIRIGLKRTGAGTNSVNVDFLTERY